jgi:hypothetical protein
VVIDEVPGQDGRHVEGHRARYADENIIAGYDLLGETIIADGQLVSLYKRVTAAIREVESNHTLIYEATTWLASSNCSRHRWTRTRC